MKINEHSLYLSKVESGEAEPQTTEPRKEVDTLLVYPKDTKILTITFCFSKNGSWQEPWALPLLCASIMLTKDEYF